MSHTNDVINQIDNMLEQGAVVDGEPNSLAHVPEQDPDIQRGQLANDMGGGEEYEDVNDEEVTDELDEALNLVDKVLDEQDSAYQTYFRGVMKKHGVTGIKHMSPDKKREFFKDVSNGWRSKKKVKEGKEVSELMQKPGQGYEKGILKGKALSSKGRQKLVNKTWNRLEPQSQGGLRKYNVRGKETVLAKTRGVKEQEIYEEYKKYFTYMMEECGIEDFEALSEVEQAEFMGLVNEAFYTMNELMQKPGAPMENPMSAHSNLIDTMKNRLRPERRVRQMAAAKQATRPTPSIIRR